MSLKRSRQPLVSILPYEDDDIGSITTFNLSNSHALVVLGSANGTLLLQPATKLYPATKSSAPTNTEGEGGGEGEGRETYHQRLTDASGHSIAWCEFSPDSAYIAACTNQGKVFIWCRTDLRRLRQEKRDQLLRQGHNPVKVDMDKSFDDSYGDESYEDVVDEFNASQNSPPAQNHFPSPSYRETEDFSLNSLSGTTPQKPELSEFEKMRLEMMELLKESPSPKPSPKSSPKSSSKGSPKGSLKGSPKVSTQPTTSALPSSPSTVASVVGANNSAAAASPGLSPITVKTSEDPETPCIPPPTSKPVSPRSPPVDVKQQDTTTTTTDEHNEPAPAPASPLQLPSYMYDVVFNATLEENNNTTSSSSSSTSTTAAPSTTTSCYSCRFSPSGKYLCVTTSSHVMIWDVERRTSVNIMGHKQEILCCSWGSSSTDDSTLVTGSADNTLSLWKYDEYFYPKNSDEKGGQGWRHEWCFEGHTAPVNAVAYGGGGAGSGGTSGTGGTGGTSGSFYSGGDLVPMFSSGSGGGGGGGLVSAREDAKSGPYVVSCSWDGTVRVWCARTMCELSCCVAISPTRLEQQFVKLRSVSLCPYNRDLVVTAEDDGACAIWNTKICKKVADLLPSGSYHTGQHQTSKT
jgi:WD40 repeat protein